MHVVGVAAVRDHPATRRRPAPVVAGARGVVPLAAALSIPLTAADGAALPRRDLILVLATAVIVVSLFVQGLTLEPLVRRAGIARPGDDARHEETVARLRLAEAALARLDELAAGECAASRGRICANPAEAVDLYTRQSCLLTSAEDLAVMSVTLADGGVNPVTGLRVVTPAVCQHVLAVMATAGMYETSGDWLFDVGCPARAVSAAESSRSPRARAAWGRSPHCWTGPGTASGASWRPGICPGRWDLSLFASKARASSWPAAVRSAKVSPGS